MKHNSIVPWPLTWQNWGLWAASSSLQSLQNKRYWCDHCSFWNEDACCDCDLSDRKISPKSVFGTSTWFEPMASTLTLQCSTNWAMKTHTLGAGKFIEFIVPVKGMKHMNIMWTIMRMKWRCDHIHILQFLAGHSARGDTHVQYTKTDTIREFRWSIGTNASIGTNRKGCHSNGSVGEYIRISLRGLNLRADSGSWPHWPNSHRHQSRRVSWQRCKSLDGEMPLLSHAGPGLFDSSCIPVCPASLH